MGVSSAKTAAQVLRSAREQGGRQGCLLWRLGVDKRLLLLPPAAPFGCCVWQGIWVSRPASFNPLISFLNEAIMTFIFLFLVNLMTARCAEAWLRCSVVVGGQQRAGVVTHSPALQLACVMLTDGPAAVALTPSISLLTIPDTILRPVLCFWRLPCRGQYLYQPSFGMYSNIILPILIGFVICSMILATGPTGFAGNPARDLVSATQAEAGSSAIAARACVIGHSGVGCPSLLRPHSGRTRALRCHTAR